MWTACHFKARYQNMNVRNERYQEIWSYLSPHKALLISFIGRPSAIEVSRLADNQHYTSIFLFILPLAVFTESHSSFIFTSVHGLQNKAGIFNRRVFTQIHGALHQEHIITVIWF
jgi:hypothetical protein